MDLTMAFGTFSLNTDHLAKPRKFCISNWYKFKETLNVYIEYSGLRILLFISPYTGSYSFGFMLRIMLFVAHSS